MTGVQTCALPIFSDAIREVPAVLECHHVAGEKDFVLKVVTEDISSYERLALDVIATIPNVGRISTIFVLSTVKRSAPIPL